MLKTDWNNYMSKRWLKLFGATLVILVALSGCSRGVGVDTVWDTQFAFDSGNTFDWAPKEPETGDDLPYDALDAAIKRAVESELAKVGYTRSTTNPALRLTYYLGIEEVTRISDPAYYGPGWGAYWGYGWYSSAGINVSQYEQGTVTLDALSTQPGVGMVFRGIATRQFDATMSDDQVTRAVESAVRKILEDFPPEPDN